MDFIASLPLLQIHVTAVFATIAVVVVSDVHGMLWLMGKLPTLPRKRMELLHKAVWAGLVCAIAAGFTMFLFYPDYLLSLWAFRFKVLFIAALLINAFLIGKHMRLAYTQSFASLSAREKRLLFISGAVSTLGWIGAYTCAQFLS